VEKIIPKNSRLFKPTDSYKIKDFVDSYLLKKIKEFPSEPLELKVFGKEFHPYASTEELSRDIFSGFNFSFRKLKPAYFNLADVKVPYEISRLQFLQKQGLMDERIHQKDSLDFNLDVNKFPQIFWNSPMDVSIRNINLIIYLIVLKLGKVPLTNIFNRDQHLITEYIAKHYEYILNNLENSGNVVGNHYLIELTSLLFTIANFDFDDKVEHFNYYHDELSKQLDYQFYSDGTNFEGSTHYTAFVIESLIICKLSIESIDSKSILLPRIEEIIKSNRLFISLLMNKDELSQIGDNDSGRLFYFNFNEDKPLDMKWLLNLIDFVYEDSLEGKKIIEKYKKEINMEALFLSGYKSVRHKPIKVFSKDYEAYSFMEFGMFIWRNDEEYFSIRCGLIGQNGVGGHSHYDQLAIECFTNDKWVARDPGTGSYTDNIELRNNFRSLEYHWGPKAKIKFPKEDEFDCFKLNYMSDGRVLAFDKYNFLGYAEFNGKRIYRKISIEEGIIYVEDYSNDVELGEYSSWGEDSEGVKVQFSEGYKRVK
tara:strand:- start:968 stop:2578 length:1611 start_codon:yes stop_codon:yes gene_type:complete